MAGSVLVLSLLVFFALLYPAGAPAALGTALATNLALGWLGADDPVANVVALGLCLVGGGILGVATAAAVHDAGLGTVQLIEAGRLGAGATGGATGLLIPEPHQWSDPETFVDLERASLERWRYLDQVTPGGLGLVELDWIGLAPGPGGLAAHQPKTVEWLDAAKIAALVPGLAWRLGGALIRHQARINPLRAIVGLADGLPSDFGFPLVTHPHQGDTAYVFPLMSDEVRVTPGASARAAGAAPPAAPRPVPAPPRPVPAPPRPVPAPPGPPCPVGTPSWRA